MNPSPVYLDNNATTRLRPEARAAMDPFLDSCYANPSSPYASARTASRALAKAREQVAALAGCNPNRLVFTSGGTESNNLALHLGLTANPNRRRLVISAVEHASVLNPARSWARRGGAVSVVPVTRDGALDLPALRAAISPDTALISIMAANNESGICYPVDECAALAHQSGALFHTDAVQAFGKIPFATGAADFVSLCAHKLHGPKGAGALVVPAHQQGPSLLEGGEQEFGLRAGTENVAALAGFGTAAELALSQHPTLAAKLAVWRADFEQSVTALLSGLTILGATQPRLPNTTLLAIEGVHTEALLAQLDWAGFCCSSGSACAAGAQQPSHVAKAHGWAEIGALLRISTSRYTQKTELENLVAVLVDGVKQLRTMHRL